MPRGQEGLVIFRNHAPHWRLAGSTYFVTWRLQAGAPALSAAERNIVQGTLTQFHGTRYRLYALVVMDDHVHVIVQPLAGHELSSIIHGWKSYSANRSQRLHGRSGQVWQKDCLDRIIRSEDDLLEKAQYILNNPEKRWAGIGDYMWAEWFEM